MSASCIMMPGSSYRGELPPLTHRQEDLARELRETVEALALHIGDRNVQRPSALAEAADDIEHRFRGFEYEVYRQTFKVGGVPCHNLEAMLPGAVAPGRDLIVGAHYDSVPGSPAANDNASGVAALLALARRWRDEPPPAITIRFVAFVNEEPPYFQTDQMGSVVYARAAATKGKDIVGMISLETIGYYADEPGSQRYPPPIGLFYPRTGDFIGFIGNHRSRRLVRKAVRSFRENARFPSEGAALPGRVPGVGWSDHWSFWQAGWPAIMVTDTAPYRYPWYHTPFDTPEKLDYERMARVVDGLYEVIRDIATDAAR